MADQLEYDGVVELSIPADFSWLCLVGACVRSILGRLDNGDVEDSLIYSVELAVHETCTNIIEHAYAGGPGRIRIETRLLENPHRIIVTLRDHGRPFEKPVIETPDPNNPKIKGYGLFLINELMDEVTYYSNAEGNYWRLIKYL